MKSIWKAAAIAVVTMFGLFGCGQESERMIEFQNKKAELQEEIASDGTVKKIETEPEELPEDETEHEEPPEDEAETEELSEEKAEIDSETETLLYTYYRQYNPLLEDENAELLQLSSYGDIRLDYAYIHSDCYEELSASLADCNTGTYDSENLYTGFCVHRADQEILSYVNRRISDAAAAEYISHTFDVASGRELALEDVVTDMDSLMEAVAKQAGKETAVSDLEAWTAGYEGLTVYLRADTEETKPIYLSYEQYSDLFEERLNHVPSGYVAGFDQYTDLVLDADEDGTEDVIQLELELAPQELDSDRHRVTNVTVRIDKQKISFQPGRYAQDYSTDGYFIQNNDGQKYIYVLTRGELDFEWYYDVIRLDREGPVYLGYYEADFSSNQPLTDPQRIKIKRECCWGTRGFHMYNSFGGIPQDTCLGYVDAEGYYTRYEDIIYFYCGEIFTATEDVEGEGVNPDGTLTGDTVTISEGEYVILLRTDISETYADYIRTDGSICRVEKEW